MDSPRQAHQRQRFAEQVSQELRRLKWNAKELAEAVEAAPGRGRGDSHTAAGHI